jgi:hypothetical protein
VEKMGKDRRSQRIFACPDESAEHRD